MRSGFEERAIFAFTQYSDSPYKLRSAFVIPNCQYFGHECDVLIIQKSDYVTEIELKATLSDLKADKKKAHGHKSNFIRQLYFGISEDIPYEEAIKHIPENAGIIRFFRLDKETYNSRWGDSLVCRITRRPKANKAARKIDQEQKIHLIKNMYYKYYHLLFKNRWKEINREAL